MRATLGRVRWRRCGAASLVGALSAGGGCSGAQPAGPVNEFSATHVAAVRGVARDTGGRPLPSVSVFVRIPSARRAAGVLYFGSTVTTGADGAFALQAERVNRLSTNTFPDPDTSAAWLHWQTLAPPYRELPGGRRKEDSVRVVLRFAPAASSPPTVVRDLQITPP